MTNHCVLLLDNFVVKLAGTYSILQLQHSLVRKPTQNLKEDSLSLQLIFTQREESCTPQHQTCLKLCNELSDMLHTKQNKHSSLCIFP